MAEHHDHLVILLYVEVKETLTTIGIVTSRSWFKGNDTRSLTKYLEQKLKHSLDELSGDTLGYFTEIVRLLCHGNKFMHILYSARLWLTSRQRDNAITSGDKFVASFLRLAQAAYEHDQCRWKLQTKFHMLGELIFSLKWDRARGANSINPLSYATQIDEDFIGRISTASRFVSCRTLHEKTIERFLLKLKACWE